MEIRDEIEKLFTLGERERGGYYEELISRHDVLSILDKWECVAEHAIGHREPAIHRIIFADQNTISGKEILIKDFLLSPGDHIIILRRRDE